MGQKSSRNRSSKLATANQTWDGMYKRNRPPSDSSITTVKLNYALNNPRKSNYFSGKNVALLGYDFGRASDEDFPVIVETSPLSPLRSPDNPVTATTAPSNSINSLKMINESRITFSGESDGGSAATFTIPADNNNMTDTTAVTAPQNIFYYTYTTDNEMGMETFTRGTPGKSENDGNLLTPVAYKKSTQSTVTVEPSDRCNNNMISSRDQFHSDNLSSPFAKRKVLAKPAANNTKNLSSFSTPEVNNNYQTKKTGNVDSLAKYSSCTPKITRNGMISFGEGNMAKKREIQVFQVEAKPRKKSSSDDEEEESETESTEESSGTGGGGSSEVSSPEKTTTTTPGAKSVYTNATKVLSKVAPSSSVYASTKVSTKVNSTKVSTKVNSTKVSTKAGTQAKDGKSKESSTVKDGDKKKGGCCKPVAPPVFIEAFNRYGDSEGYGGGGRGKNGCVTPADRLKNVDVVEELLYYVPSPNDCNANDDQEFDYYCIDECGEMQLVGSGYSPPKSLVQSNCNPVKYSRRQRFNFRNSRDEDDEAPPFSWQATQNCCCPCCRAGLRRNPNCCCMCCQTKGSARASNSFDEIPVGKNPQIQAKNFEDVCTSEEGSEKGGSDEDSEEGSSDENCEDLVPRESGLYFYDAKLKKFVRQQAPTTPPPIVVDAPAPPLPPPPNPVEVFEVEPKQKRRSPQVQPVIQPMLMNPPQCPPPPCCGNRCNCNCNPPTPPCPAPNYVPIMMCGGNNGGRGRPRPCCPPPRHFAPPPQGPPQQFPPPFQGPPSYGAPQPQKPPSPQPAQKPAPKKENKKESREESPADGSYSGGSGSGYGSGYYDDDFGTAHAITASVAETEDETITTVIVPPGHKGDVKIAAK